MLNVKLSLLSKTTVEYLPLSIYTHSRIRTSWLVMVHNLTHRNANTLSIHNTNINIIYEVLHKFNEYMYMYIHVVLWCCTCSYIAFLLIYMSS